MLKDDNILIIDQITKLPKVIFNKYLNKYLSNNSTIKLLMTSKSSKATLEDKQQLNLETSFLKAESTSAVGSNSIYHSHFSCVQNNKLIIGYGVYNLKITDNIQVLDHNKFQNVNIIGLKPKPMYDFAWTYDKMDSLYLTGGSHSLKCSDPLSQINSNLFLLNLLSLSQDFEEQSISFDIVKSYQAVLGKVGTRIIHYPTTRKFISEQPNPEQNYFSRISKKKSLQQEIEKGGLLMFGGKIYSSQFHEDQLPSELLYIDTELDNSSIRKVFPRLVSGRQNHILQLIDPQRIFVGFGFIAQPDQVNLFIPTNDMQIFDLQNETLTDISMQNLAPDDHLVSHSINKNKLLIQGGNKGLKAFLDLDSREIEFWEQSRNQKHCRGSLVEWEGILFELKNECSTHVRRVDVQMNYHHQEEQNYNNFSRSEKLRIFEMLKDTL